MSDIYAGTGIFSSLSDFFGQSLSKPAQTQSKSSSFLGTIVNDMKARIWIFPVWLLIVIGIVILVAVVMF
jgi:hypothetical protein